MRRLLNKVLIVDDEPVIRNTLSLYLKEAGYEVCSAENGRQALDLIDVEQPAYLITDWNMPEMDGLELCRRVRQMDLPGYLYIVFLTVRGEQADLMQAMDAGADDFLIKPLHKHELLARLIAGARVLRLESHLSQLAAHDPDRAADAPVLCRFADQRVGACHRYRAPLSAVMLDIDYFKEINDTFGHPAGDEVIRNIADLLRQHTRQSDILCRYGGEEFCVLLPETRESDAVTWAERFRQRVADQEVPAGQRNMRVTVSLGVMEMLAEMEDKNELLKIVDQCLLSAKERGRNRVVSFRSISEQGEADGDRGYDQDGVGEATARDAMIPLVHCLQADWSVARAAAYLLCYRVSSVPVTDEQGNLLGIVSEKDVLRIARTPGAPTLRVAEIMRSNVIAYDVATPLVRVVHFLTRSAMRERRDFVRRKTVRAAQPRGTAVRWFLETCWQLPDAATAGAARAEAGERPAFARRSARRGGPATARPRRRWRGPVGGCAVGRQSGRAAKSARRNAARAVVHSKCR